MKNFKAISWKALFRLKNDKIIGGRVKRVSKGSLLFWSEQKLDIGTNGLFMAQLPPLKQGHEGVIVKATCYTKQVVLAADIFQIEMDIHSWHGSDWHILQDRYPAN
ncbi:MAG: hypothetical protein WC426_02790 [Sulfuriferula sp.]